MTATLSLSLVNAYSFISTTAAILMAVTTGSYFGKNGWKNPFKKPPKNIEKLPKQLSSIWMLDLATRIFKFLAAVIYSIFNMGATFFGLLSSNKPFVVALFAAIGAAGYLYIYVYQIPNRKKRMRESYLGIVMLIATGSICSYFYMNSDFSDGELYEYHQKNKQVQEKMKQSKISKIFPFTTT